MKPHIEVILPVYNEIQNIPPLLNQLDVVAFEMKEEVSFSYLFINDGSTDGTTQLLREAFECREDIRVVNLIHNFGHGAAITAGIEYFKGDIALLMDADLQDAPSALKPMFEKWKQGAKTVVAERRSRREKFRILFEAFYAILHRSAKSLPPIAFGTHCLLDKEVVKRIRLLGERNRYFPGLVAFSSEEIASVEIDRQARNFGDSRVGFYGLIQLAVTALLSFSSVPIRFVSAFGLINALGAVGSAVGIVGIKCFTQLAIPGWASIMTATFFIGGVQMLCLGLIGEYIARIYDEVKARPMYLTEEVLEPDLVQDTLRFNQRPVSNA